MLWRRRQRCGLLIGAWGLGLLLVLPGCAAPPPPAAPPTRTVDLSHVVRQDVPYLPDEPRTRLVRAPDGDLREATIGMRTGTLLAVVAAPGTNPTTVDLLSGRDLILPAVVLDLRDDAQDTPGYRLSTAAIRAWEAEHGPIPAQSMVLLLTGWDLHWGAPAAYLRLDGSGAPQTPALSAEAVALLFDERGAAGLGLDAPAVTIAPAEGQRLLLANLTNLEQLPPTGATLFIGALRLQAAAASPARVLAVVP